MLFQSLPGHDRNLYRHQSNLCRTVVFILIHLPVINSTALIAREQGFSYLGGNNIHVPIDFIQSIFCFSSFRRTQRPFLLVQNSKHVFHTFLTQIFIDNAYLNDLGNSLPELIELFILQYTLAIIRPQSFFHVLSRINIFHIYSSLLRQLVQNFIGSIKDILQINPRGFLFCIQAFFKRLS